MYMDPSRPDSLYLPLLPVPAHGTRIDFPINRNGEPAPLPCVFHWHYIQCVLKRFGSAAVKQQSMCYMTVPFQTRSEKDKEEEGGDLGTDQSYPQQEWDQLLREARHHRHVHSTVDNWLAQTQQAENTG